MSDDGWKEMKTIVSKTFKFNDGFDWHYEVKAYSDEVDFKYFENGVEKERFTIPTFVAARMLPIVANMAKDAEE